MYVKVRLKQRNLKRDVYATYWKNTQSQNTGKGLAKKKKGTSTGILSGKPKRK